MELNYDVGESLNVNFQELENLITLPKLKLFNGLFSGNLEEYNNIRTELKKAQGFLLQLFRNSREQYEQEFGESAIEDDGSIEIMGQKFDKDGNMVVDKHLEEKESSESWDEEEQVERKRFHSVLRFYQQRDEDKKNSEDNDEGTENPKKDQDQEKKEDG